MAESVTNNWVCVLSTPSSGPPPDRPEFLSFTNDGFRNHHKRHKIAASFTMTMDSRSSQTRKKEELSIQAPATSIPQAETSRLSDLRFDRLQIPEKELIHEDKFEFGQFVARDAIIDEEFWTAAWLRAESHWEDRINDRYVDNHKRKFAEQEFHAIKRRRTAQHGQKCRCIVTGESFPGERVKVPVFRTFCRRGPNTYGYVANLCVAKSARRQGIASNMLHFAVESVKSDGVEHLFVHVHRDNSPAQDLYQKMGFKIVEAASSQLLEEKTYLLCCRV